MIVWNEPVYDLLLDSKNFSREWIILALDASPLWMHLQYAKSILGVEVWTFLSYQVPYKIIKISEVERVSYFLATTKEEGFDIEFCDLGHS